MSNKPFNYRSFTAFIVTWAFLVATLTGVVLYIVPQGRIANWVNWEMLGLLKSDWGNIHLVFGAIFIAGGILHLYYNWKPFKKYIAEKSKGHFHPKKELVWSVVVSLFLIAGAITQTPPFSYYFQLNEWAKQTWVTSPDIEPPFGHAEELSLTGFAKRQNMDLDKVKEEFDNRAIRYDSIRQPIGKIAEANGLNPMQLYSYIKQFEAKPEPVKDKVFTSNEVEDTYNGTGIGKKSLFAISEMLGVPLDDILKKLSSVNMPATKDETTKAIGRKYNIEPIDIMKIILVPDFKTNPQG